MDPGRIHGNSNPMPLGYRFHPTSIEVLLYYLIPKLKGEALPSDCIKDLDVYGDDPNKIPLNKSMYARENEAYFFVPVPVTRELLLEGGEDNLTRTTCNGYWKVFKENVPVDGPLDGGAAIGYKNKLEFYYGKNPDGIKTDWKMVEYRTNFRINGNVERLMVCKVRRLKVDEIYEEEDGGVVSGDEGGTNGNTRKFDTID